MTHVLTTSFILWIPLLPLVGFVLNSVIALRQARLSTPVPEKLVSVIACFFPLLSFMLAVRGFLILLNDHSLQSLTTGPLLEWMGTPLIQVSFGFLMDHLSAVMTLVVTGVGSLIHVYSTGYMHEDKGFARYFSYLNLFLFFMLVLVLGDGLLPLFVGWEGVGLCSYLLIGYWFDDPQKAKAGKKAFVVNRVGDFGFLAGIFMMVLLFSAANNNQPVLLTYDFILKNTQLLAPMATLITLCLFIGATGKSAQIPLYVWLPDAMAGPTPVSALIHAATMVTAGIYMVARLFPVFLLAPFTLKFIAGIGLGTAMMAALIAITQNDIKKVLAYSTVSQLGYMFLALGVGAPQAAIFHVVTHAFFKACLFLCSGSVIYALHHEQDIRHMGGLLKKMPVTGYAFLVSTLAIAGIPPFAGFFSKDEILWQTYQTAPRIYYILAVATAGLTAFYMFRLFTKTFLGDFRGHHAPHKLKIQMDLPVALLAILAVIGGFMGVPAVLGGSNHFHHWLEYLTPPAVIAGDHHTLELSLMGLSILVASVMSLVSVVFYLRKPGWTTFLKTRFSGVYQLLSNKFYVDEIYQGLIVNPVYAISKYFLWKGSDQKLIDGLMVHGWSSVSGVVARIVSALQTGSLGHYLLFLWLGLIVFLMVIVRT